MGTEAKLTRNVSITVGTHALLILVTFFSTESLLDSAARLADEDMDFHRHVDFRLLWVLFPIWMFCRKHITVMILVFLGTLIVDWKACHHLVRRRDESWLWRVSVGVTTASLIAVLVCAYAVDEYVANFAGKMEIVREYYKANRDHWKAQQADAPDG